MLGSRSRQTGERGRAGSAGKEEEAGWGEGREGIKCDVRRAFADIKVVFS